MKIATLVSVARLAGVALSVACPLESLERAGVLSKDDEATFNMIKPDPKMAEVLFEIQKRQSNKVVGPRKKDGTLDLPCGGGLLNGALQPLTGPLSQVIVPSAQSHGLIEIPGNDANHQFQAPRAVDVRGACPALNTLANHGYISRTGITTFAEVSNAVQTAYGFSFPLSTVLSAIALIVGGDVTSGRYSIGGADPRVPNTLGPALGLDTHNVFEIDGSITREDAYFSNNANFLLARWDEYNLIATKYGNFNLETQAEDNGFRYDNSRNRNAAFFAGVPWLVFSNAMRYFVPGGLANGTTPGNALYASVASFFLSERFPTRWFRRGSPLTLSQAASGVGQLYRMNPRELGGNHGVGNFSTLRGKRPSTPPACFFVQNMLDLAPGYVNNRVPNAYESYAGFLKGAVAPFFISDGVFNCPVTLYDPPPQRGAIVTNADGAPGRSASGSPVNGTYS